MDPTWLDAHLYGLAYKLAYEHVRLPGLAGTNTATPTISALAGFGLRTTVILHTG